MGLLQDLHDSEINASIACFAIGAWTVKLGDPLNGFKAEETVGSEAEALDWLTVKAIAFYPESLFAAQCAFAEALPDWMFAWRRLPDGSTQVQIEHEHFSEAGLTVTMQAPVQEVLRAATARMVAGERDPDDSEVLVDFLTRH